MPKKDIGFRFSEETHAQLLELSKKFNCTRTEIIERLIADEMVAKDLGDPPPLMPGKIEKVDEPDKAAASMTVPGGKSEGRKNTPPPTEPAAPKFERTPRPLTREEREARIDAMQRKMAKKK